MATDVKDAVHKGATTEISKRIVWFALVAVFVIIGGIAVVTFWPQISDAVRKLDTVDATHERSTNNERRIREFEAVTRTVKGHDEQVKKLIQETIPAIQTRLLEKRELIGSARVEFATELNNFILKEFPAVVQRIDSALREVRGTARDAGNDQIQIHKELDANTAFRIAQQNRVQRRIRNQEIREDRLIEVETVIEKVKEHMAREFERRKRVNGVIDYIESRKLSKADVELELLRREVASLQKQVQRLTGAQ